MKPFLNLFVAMSFGLALSGCDGGGEEPAPAPAPAPNLGTAEGFWEGTGSTNRVIAGVVLDDGVYWFLYSASGSTNQVAGLIQGSSAAANGAFTSSDGRDFSASGVFNFSVSGNYVQKSTLGGTTNYASGSTGSFNATYNNNYEQVPNLSAVAGTYQNGDATQTVTVNSNGQVTFARSDGCNGTATATPRSRGNVFNVTANFGAGCGGLSNLTVTGIGVPASSNTRLLFAGLNSGRTIGAIFIGGKV